MFASVMKFNPNHDRLGRFTTRGGSQASAIFASSFMGSDGTIPTAISSLRSRPFARFKFMSQKIDRSLGLLGGVEGAIGAWADGAEHSTVTSFASASNASTRVAAAMRGLLFKQKAVITMHYDPNGKSRVHEFTVDSNDPKELNKELVAAGLPFHTLIPNRNGTTKVVLFDEQGTAEHDHAVKVAASHFKATSVATFRGKGELIGTFGDGMSDAKARKTGAEQYQKIIDKWLSQNPGNKQIWNEIQRAHKSGAIKSQEYTPWAI